MQVSHLSAALTQPLWVGDEVALKVMLDLTVYLEGPTERDFEFLLDLYESVCPPTRLREFKIAELPLWSSLAQPILTMHGRAAAAAGIRRPYFEPVRERIRQGRAFEAQYWDGQEIDVLSGSWSLNCRRIHLRSEGLFTFARLLLPLDTELDVLVSTAVAIAENVPLHSGHGGLAFVYEPLLLDDAFDAIYSRARRFWGVDIEHMNGTLPLTKDGIKGVNWITLVGNAFALKPDIRTTLASLRDVPSVTTTRHKQAYVLIAGDCPSACDRNRPDASDVPYVAVANALAPLFLTGHPDFPGERFAASGNTMGWIRRFFDPAGWR
ncbi:type VI immunity family protein [Mesorhizobium sp. NPDC059054]|uniref:type VI immunity family protein n=1 Tax=Mesorhizobium sp. NPDC059054 TaxID=3346711 RepID=UPI003685DA01